MSEEEIKEPKKRNFVKINEFYYALSWLVAFVIIILITGFFTFREMFINFSGITLIIVFLFIKEGGIRYEIKR